jgi:hypothetical protein
MIRISCTNCKTILSIDDAFAGGVCRCQHCGTIQTVPAQARGNAQQVGVGGPAIGGSKSLYQNGSVQPGEGTGLDDLASVVVSSGLTSSRLKRSTRTAEERKAKQNLLIPVLIGSGVLVIALVFVILYLLLRNPATPNTAAGGGQTITQIAPPVVTGPSFCGAPLTGNTVVYLLDRGTATKDFLGALKDAALKSATSLTGDRKFAILFWNDGKDAVIAYPESGTAYATKDTIDSARKALGDDVTAYGQTDINDALKLALDQHPDEIVIATGKGSDLENAWTDEALTLRGKDKVKIDTISLGSGESGPLKRLAKETGGSYRELTRAELENFGN